LRVNTWLASGGSLSQAVIEGLYGQIPNEELLPMISWLSAILFTIIGGFWLLDSLKDTVFASIVGLRYQPWAKACSVLFTLVLTLGYNTLVDRVARPTMFYLVGGTYTAIFLTIAFLLSDPDAGIRNEMRHPGQSARHSLGQRWPPIMILTRTWVVSGRLLGWASYLAIESYGSLSTAMFWAMTNSSMELEGAKSAYGLILAGAQLGAVLGSTFATSAGALSLPTLYMLGGLTPSVMAGLIWRYNKVYGRYTPPPPPNAVLSRKDASTSILEGLQTVFRHPYVLALAGISCLYEVVLTILDYEMKVRRNFRARVFCQCPGSRPSAACVCAPVRSSGW
jgi:ATP:ADP antiporter, AAA family